MSIPLEGRIALVTGVSRRQGIGAEVVRRLITDGVRVFATGWPDHDVRMPWGGDSLDLEKLISEHAADGRFHYEVANLEDPLIPERLVESTIRRFGEIDILVANHARSSNQSLSNVTSDDLDLCWAVNARASILFAQALGRHRAKRRGGRLILFTSGQHLQPMPDEIAYSVSKGALHQMTASLAEALADQEITVNCINPGPVDTGWAKGAMYRGIESRFPSKRWGQPGDIANIIAWLVTDEAEWITGQVLNAEGGFRRWVV